MLGDDGEAFFNSDGDGLLSNNNALGIAIETTDQTLGGNDTITINGNGDNVIFGGSGADTIAVNGNGDNVIFGDNGAASYIDGVLTEVATTGETAPAEVFGNIVFSELEVEQHRRRLWRQRHHHRRQRQQRHRRRLRRRHDHHRNRQQCRARRQRLCGIQSIDRYDDVVRQSHRNRVGSVMIVRSGAPQLDLTSWQHQPRQSSNDTITLGDGNNVVIGGAGADTIVVGATGANVIIGDDGEADYTNGILTDIFSTDGTLGIGGNDTISGPNGTPGGSGDNVVIGGIGADTDHARRRQQHDHRRRRRSDVRHVGSDSDHHRRRIPASAAMTPSPSPAATT